MRIAMIGQRGVPATFGGIERHVEEIGARLAARGHEVTVFCRRNYADSHPSVHRGMRLRHLPTIGTKHLDAFAHSALSSAAAVAGRFEIAHYHALGPGLFAPLPRALSSAKVVQTIHGLDDQRAKWSAPAKAVLASARWLSHRVPHATILVSQDLARLYARSRGVTVHIPNGVVPPGPATAELIGPRFGLSPRSYLLFVGRLVPEKAPDLLLRSFRRLGGDRHLVIAGGSSFTDGFVRSLEEMAARDPRVLLAGYVYGRELAELYANAAAFVLPSALEGLPLTLLEAAAHGTPVVASDIPPHVEILGAGGPGRRLFRSGDEEGLARVLGDLLGDLDREREGAAAFAADVLARYSWDRVADATEDLYLRLAEVPRRRATAAAGGARMGRTAHRERWAERDRLP